MAGNEADDHGSPTDTDLEPDLYSEDPRIQGDFAILVPDNRAARTAFDNVVTTLKEHDEGRNILWSRLMQVHGERSDQEPESQTSDEETGLDEMKPVIETRIWTGHYRLNIEEDMLPKQFTQFGWIVGGGSKSMVDDGVAFKLTTDKRGDGVRSRHARFAFSTDYNLTLVVDEGKRVWVDGDMISGESRAISRLSTRLQFGDKLAYRLQYTGMSEMRYRDQMDNLRSKKLVTSTIHKTLEVTPNEEQFEFQGYVIHPPIDYGGFGIISACVRKAGGQTFAVKRVARKRGTQVLIERELRMMRAVGGHPNTCTLVEVLGDTSDYDNARYRDNYIVHTSLATDGNFATLRVSTEDELVKLVALSGAVRGVVHIHEKGWMHRDIKPTNILWSRSDLRAVVADCGQGTDEKESRDHHKGTIGYLAPEVMRLKEADQQQEEHQPAKAYDNKCDVYSLGIVGFELFFTEQERDKAMAWLQKHQPRQDRLQNYKAGMSPYQQRLSSFISKMLSLEAAERPSMQEVGSWEIWTRPECNEESPS